MTKTKYIILAAAAALALTQSSCDVERLPYGSMATDQIQADPDKYLDALMNGAYAQLGSWADPMHRCGEYAGDNVAIRGYSTDAFFEFISFSRSPNNYRLDQFWNSGYKAIAQVSNIINMFEEGQSASVDQCLGECYYMRGMLYFYFVRAYGRPYYQAADRNLGIPVVNGTPDNILSNDFFLSDRKTVKENYELIIADLEKAAQLMNENRGASRPSVGAANALLSRVYLYMSGTYENPNTEYAQKAADYASKVINSGEYSLLSRDELMQYIKPAPEANSEAIFAVKHLASEYSGFDHYYGVGGMYANIGGMGWGEMYASQKYMDLLDETGRNDWREDHYRMVDARAAYIEPTYEDKEVARFTFTSSTGDVNYAQLSITRNADGSITASEGGNSYQLTPVNVEQEIYTISYNGQTCKAYIDNYITLNRANPQFYINKQSRETEDSHLFSPMISRLGEVYLNRAEAYAKLGQYGNALADLNVIRNRAIINGGYDSLDASNAAERIDKERTLELAFEAERSYDVFRNGGILTRHYPGAHTQSIEVKATDYRVVYYIPQNAINAYPGVITQNPTSDSGVIL